MIQPPSSAMRPERGDMHPALLVEGGDDAFPDHGHGGYDSERCHEASRFRLAISVWPASFSLRLVVGRRVRRHAPIERLVLGVALGQPEGDLGSRQLGAEIEGMRPVLLDAELGEQVERVLRHVMAVAVIDMDAVLGDLDAEILVAHLARGLGDLRRAFAERAGANARQSSPSA